MVGDILTPLRSNAKLCFPRLSCFGGYPLMPTHTARYIARQLELCRSIPGECESKETTWKRPAFTVESGWTLGWSRPKNSRHNMADLWCDNPVDLLETNGFSV